MQVLPIQDKPGAVSEPEPVPAFVAVSVWVSRVKVAETDLLPAMVTMQRLLLVESQPDQLSKCDPVSAVAVMVMVVPQL